MKSIKDKDKDTVMYGMVRSLRELSELEIKLGEVIRKAENEELSKNELIHELKKIKHKIFGL